jgi:hypothetical protein
VQFGWARAMRLDEGVLGRGRAWSDVRIDRQRRPFWGAPPTSLLILFIYVWDRSGFTDRYTGSVTSKDDLGNSLKPEVPDNH